MLAGGAADTMDAAATLARSEGWPGGSSANAASICRSDASVLFVVDVLLVDGRSRRARQTLGREAEMAVGMLALGRRITFEFGGETEFVDAARRVVREVRV